MRWGTCKLRPAARELRTATGPLVAGLAKALKASANSYLAENVGVIEAPSQISSSRPLCQGGLGLAVGVNALCPLYCQIYMRTFGFVLAIGLGLGLEAQPPAPQAPVPAEAKRGSRPDRP